MIAYEELCEALSRWRAKNGLPSSPSARPPRAQGIVTSAPPPAELFGGAIRPQTGDEHTATNVSAVPEDPDDELPPPIEGESQRRDNTSEIDIDSVEVLDEEEV